MKNVLIVLNNFYPEVSSLAQLYTDLCMELSDSFCIKVICAVPSYTGEIEDDYIGKLYYSEKFHEISILRIGVSRFDKSNKVSRVKSLIKYFFGAVFAVFREGNIDLTVAVSQPPVIGGVIGSWYKWYLKCPLIYNIQDFNPEQIVSVNYSKNRILIDILRQIDNATCKRADMISVVSNDMKDTLSNRFKGRTIPNCVSISNWVDEKIMRPLSKEEYKVKWFREKYGLSEKMVFMYSGNLGLIYDLENIVSEIAKFKDDKEVVFAFVGQGNMKSRLEAIAQEERASNIIFIPYQRNEDLVYSLNAADVHFVFSAKGMKGVASPSKLYGIMAVGKPIIAMLEKGMESRQIIENAECGVVIEPGDYSGLSNCILDMKRERASLEKIGQQGRVYYCKHLGREKSIMQYRELFEKMIGVGKGDN